eukprot:TRINITY_DN3905_c4_g3_i1.p1 TRINITY_DN3905_c4_g3~~TRINITY_DN3905_c4_g3_i1.p1  ORF type:complete len:448 (+),score=143.21 TRINITY_DN3905_c4_g3_i1:97-1344(+)
MSPTPSPAPTLGCSDHTLGVVLIVLVAVIWVAASQLIRAIFDDLNFDKPFFLTYFNTCGFSVWLLAALVVPSWRSELTSRQRAPRPSTGSWWAAATTPGVRMYLGIAFTFWPAWMLANYLFNVSLDHTSVASNSVLSNTSSLWTMLLSAALLGDKFNAFKTLAVVVTIGGAAMVAQADSKSKAGSGSGSDSSEDWGGDLLALLSAFMYGVYTVLLKLRLPADTDVRMPIVFGFVGLSVLLCCWPLLLVLNATGAENFEWPAPRVLGWLVLNTAVGTNLSDVIWARAVVLTSPLVATLGLSLTIPLGMVSDVILHGKAFSLEYVGGSCLVLAGFVLANCADSLWAHIRSKKAQEREYSSVLPSPGHDPECEADTESDSLLPGAPPPTRTSPLCGGRGKQLPQHVAASPGSSPKAGT